MEPTPDIIDEPAKANRHLSASKKRETMTSGVSVDFFDPAGVSELREVLRHRPADSHSPPKNVDFADAEQEFDLEKTIRSVLQRRIEASIHPRQLDVGFKDLRVKGIGALASFQPMVGSILNPFSTPQNLSNAWKPPVSVRDIISGFEGTVRLGEMLCRLCKGCFKCRRRPPDLVVMGRPGAGCSTFLKAISNHREEYHAVEGGVHYDAIPPEGVQKYFRGDVQYCPEDEVYFPTLTVEQALGFAATTRTPRNRLDDTRAQWRESLITILTTVFGPRHARKTPVGNAALAGISGGEKKRVSIAEALATRARIGCWDNSTRGLDSSTALEFVRALRIATDTMQLSTVVSIYQARQSVYELFDKVCVIYEGKLAYFEPASLAKDYFIDMGCDLGHAHRLTERLLEPSYEPAGRQTTPDFLVAVTDPTARPPNSGQVRNRSESPTHNFWSTRKFCYTVVLSSS